MEGTPVCQVCIANTMRDYYDYAYGNHKPSIGARVWVTFRGKAKVGVVVGHEISQLPASKIRFLDEIIDAKPLLDKSFFDLAHWVARYYQAPLSEVMATVLPKQFRQGKAIETCWENEYQLKMPADKAEALIDNRKKKLRQMVNWLAKLGCPVSESMGREGGYSKRHWEMLLELGVVAKHRTLVPPTHAKEGQDNLQLNDQQAQAVKRIQSELHHYHCFLLQGVTGSGKTEVYQQVIEQVMAAGKQVLLLVPEIGLTPQLLSRFRQRFNQPMVMIHSQLNDSERFRAWVLAREAKVSLIIGTRTALFTPLPNLGLVVLDEEHDLSFKQMAG